ncbi:hypothetical protein [Schlesneria paludicola]|nr:hypothetical protein [Schlesneria paludicola]
MSRRINRSKPYPVGEFAESPKSTLDLKLAWLLPEGDTAGPCWCD